MSVLHTIGRDRGNADLEQFHRQVDEGNHERLDLARCMRGIIDLDTSILTNARVEYISYVLKVP